MSKKATYQLENSIKRGEEIITELSFRELRVKDLKQLDSVMGDIQKTAKFIELSACIPPSTVDEINFSDLKAINDLLVNENFF